jgi:glucokinase
VEKERVTILAGDIGGTHARLALYEQTRTGLKLMDSKKFASREYPSLKQVIRDFLHLRQVKVASACFGVAGPVKQGTATASNLPWIVRQTDLVELLNTSSVRLLNDLEAAAYGIDELRPEEFLVLGSGKATDGNRALMACGTGLGEAMSVRVGNRYLPLASEGGHSDFSPKDGFEFELLEFLSHQFGHVSWERVLSGSGITNLYRFLQLKNPLKEGAALSAALSTKDPSIEIIKAAVGQENENCRKSLDLFFRFLGREAGNLALKAFATGGIYLGGGIVPRVSSLLRQSEFFKEFSSKGRMHDLLVDIPIRVILRDDVGVLGAAKLASLSEQKKLEGKTA